MYRDSRILVTEAYSASNIGDLELVQRTVECALGRSADVRCLAVDPQSFTNHLPVPVKDRLFPRLRMLKSSSLMRAWTMVVWTFQILMMSVIGWLPYGSRRSGIAMARRLRLLPEAADEYLNASEVLAVGGGYLGDQYKKETVMTLWTWWWAGRMGLTVETMPISCEIGTIKLRLVARVLGRRVKWRVRDSASVSSLSGCGISCELVPDLAFANVREPSEVRDLTVLALVGSDYLGEEGVNKLAQGVAEAVKGQDLPTPVSIVTMHTPLSGTSVGGDLRVAHLLEDRLARCGVTDVEIVSLTSFDEVCNLCERASVVISARMHAGIAALCAGARVGLLAYEEKHFSLMRDLELKEYVIPIGAAPSEICALAGRLVNADYSEFRAPALNYRERLFAAGIAPK